MCTAVARPTNPLGGRITWIQPIMLNMENIADGFAAGKQVCAQANSRIHQVGWKVMRQMAE